MSDDRHPGPEDDTEAVYRSLGALTRMVHEGLRQLGLDRMIEDAVSSLPDARDRLNYIARISGDAADQVIGQVEQARKDLTAFSEDAGQIRCLLAADPDALLASGELADFLDRVDSACTRSDVMLTEILVAQSFHDLSSQVIAQVLELATGLEEGLVSLLNEVAPRERNGGRGRRAAPGKGVLDGPVVTGPAQAGGSVVTSQAQVDELLADLGF